MATYSEILKKLLGRLDSVPDTYYSSILKVQDEMFKDILPLLDRMELDEFGKVKPTAKNYALSAEIQEKLPKILDKSGFTDILKGFAKDMNEQRALTDALYETILDSPSFSSLDVLWNQSRKNAIGLLGENSSAEFYNVFADAMNTSIGSSSSFTELLANIRQVTTGNAELDGQMARYAKVYASEAYSNSNSAYTKALSDKYGIVFKRYSGAIMDTTRPFCLERVGKYFHDEEIKQWGEGSKCCNLVWPQNDTWAGRKNGTNSTTIFTNLAGWNCRHHLAPVPIDKVPIRDLKRAIDKGYIDKSDLPERVLSKLGSTS